MDPWILLLVVIVVAFGGMIKGMTGFGYALAATALLSVIIEPNTAVVIMILPILAANVALVGELGWAQLRPCLERFSPYLVAATAGTIIGMLFLDLIPQDGLRVVIGVLTLGYVAMKQPWLGRRSRQQLLAWCLLPGWTTMSGLGFASGVVFGAGNVGVPVVAYFDHLSVPRSTFVGMLALVFVGISSVRVGLAWWLGFYGAGSVFGYSVLAVVPALAGVAIGRRVGRGIDELLLLVVILGLLSIIGIRLILAGTMGV